MQLEQYEFEELCLNDRLHLIWAMGVFVSRVQTHSRSYMLYTVYNYYVELTVRHDKSTRVTHAVAFRNDPRINKHLAQISLDELLN